MNIRPFALVVPALFLLPLASSGAAFWSVEALEFSRLPSIQPARLRGATDRVVRISHPASAPSATKGL